MAEKTGVPVGSQELLKGFPPRLIALPADCDSGVLGSIGIQAGDSITVRQCSVSQLHHVSNSEAAISIKNEHQSQLDTVAGMVMHMLHTTLYTQRRMHFYFQFIKRRKKNRFYTLTVG